MTRFLVTGGAGFIGSNFVHHLMAHTDATVTVLDKLTYAGNRASLDGLPEQRFDFVHGDICDPALVDDLVATHDVVVHYAAESHNDNSLRDPSPFLTTNLIGTYTLLEAVRRHQTRFHHISTDEVYGDLELDDPRAVHRTDAVQPVQPVLLDQGRLGPARPGLGPLVRRPGHDQQLLEQLRPVPARGEVHPAADHQRPRRRPAEAVRGRAERPGLDPRRRPQRRGADDRRAGHDRGDLPDRGGRGAEQPRGRADHPGAARAARRDDFDHVTDRAGHDLRYAIDSTKLRAELGWRPRFADFAAGLEQTIGWYRDHEAWWRPQKAATEAQYAAQGK